MRRIATGFGVAVAATLLAWYYWLGLTTFVGQVWDDVTYLTVAKAIATGQGYRDLNLPGAPPHVSYPPLYPLALAAVWRLFPDFPANVLAFKALNVAFALPLIALTYRLAARTYGMPRWQAGLAALMLAFGTFIPMAADLTMSELLFALVLVGVLGAIEGLADEERPRAWAPVAIGALAALAMMTRGLGVAVVAGTVAWLFLRGRRREALLAGAAAAACLAPWFLYVRLARAEAQQFDYLSWTVAHTDGFDLGLLAGLVAQHVPEILVRSIPATVAPGLGLLAALGAAKVVGPLAVSGAVIAGLVRLARPRPHLLHAVLLVYFAIILPFPWETSRYVAALSPLLIIAFVRGATWPAEAALAGMPGRPGRRAVAMGLSAVLLLIGLAGVKRAAGLLRRDAFHDALLSERDRRTVADHRAIAAWAAEHLPPDAIWLSHRAPLWYLLTGHRAVGYADGPEPSAATTALWKARPAYVVSPVEPTFAWHFDQFLARHPDKAELVYRSPEGVYHVYRVSRSW